MDWCCAGRIPAHLAGLGYVAIPRNDFERFAKLTSGHTRLDAQRLAELEPSLDGRFRDGLFFAGQMSGVEGYVESASSGLLAGIGASLRARGKEPAGDLLYELKVLAPTDLTPKERALMQDLANSLKDRGVPDPRAELMASKS